MTKQLGSFFTVEDFEQNGARYRCVDCNLRGLTHPNNRPIIAGKLALDKKQLLVGKFSVKRITNRRDYKDELVFTIRSEKRERLWTLTLDEGRNDSSWDYVEIYFPFAHADQLLTHLFKELVYR